MPPVAKWINGELSFNQIKSINIEDLLERDPIKLDTALINEQLNHKTILITGAVARQFVGTGAGVLWTGLARRKGVLGRCGITLIGQVVRPIYDRSYSAQLHPAKPCNEPRTAHSVLQAASGQSAAQGGAHGCDPVFCDAGNGAAHPAMQ